MQSTLLSLPLLLLVTAPAAAQQPPDASGDPGAADLARKLQNPVADLISVPFQLNYDESYGMRDASRYTLNIQPVIPLGLSDDWNLITRTILPVIRAGSPAYGVDDAFGLGDTLQSFFLSPKEPIDGWIMGAGPAVLWPTGTEPEIRSEQLALGPTAVFLRQSSGWTYGVLANQLWNVTNAEENPRVNASFVQPFLTYTWPTSTTLALNAESTYDWTADQLTLPFNLQLSQVWKLGGQPVSFQLGGRYYAERPSRGPDWGARFAITLLFPK